MAVQGIIMALLLTHECIVETLDFPETRTNLEFSYTEEQLHHINPGSTVLPSNYVIDIDVRFFDYFLVNYIQSIVRNISLPFTLSSSTNITDIDMNTVCGLNGTEYECKCEEDHVWPNDTCRAYQVCDSIVGGTCGCIQAFPSEGPLCQRDINECEDGVSLCVTLPLTEYLIEIQINCIDSSITDELRTLLMSFILPYTISESTNITEVNITTVPPSPATASTAATPAPADTTFTAKTKDVNILKMSLRVNEPFDTSLNNLNEAMYLKYANTITSAIEASYTTLSIYIKDSAKVTKFRPGSIIADYEINVTTNSLSSINSDDFALANTAILKTLLKAGITPALNAISESEQKNLSTTEKIYPFQKMELRCTGPESVNSTVKWTVNDQDPTLDAVRYFISPDGGTLIVNNATEKDNGRYLCIMERATIPYIQWQTIFLEERPNIVVGKTEINVQCVDKLVQLTCCERKYDVEWIPVPSGDEVTPQVAGCITLKHKIKSGNCENDTFTCRLKDPVLKDFVYGWNRVTVQKIEGEFSCQNDTLGVGYDNQFVTGPCGKDWDGTITYRCTLGIWTEFRRSCVLQVFIDLKRKVLTLIVEQIPEFMSDLRAATVAFTEEVTESPLTVQTIVDILTNIASISQNIIISKSVMEDFLKTVDILVSDKSAASWQSLAKDNTSISLLSAIEDVAARLSDGDFVIDKTSIQLNRTVIKNSYIGKSNLPNTTLEIFIPQVHEPTSVTIIVFSTLDNVIPTRDTNDNSSGYSDLLVHGDVVVVKVNKTLNNISFIFDINNLYLGYPHCVFWNFNLDAWDSVGCEIKTIIDVENETRKITCECNHTTSFSVLMSPVFMDYIIITGFGVTISMASLILCLIIEAIAWKMVRRNDTSYMRHVSIVNTAFSLLIANICFIIGDLIAGKETPVGLCSAVVFFMHIFYLAIFFWMLISALLLFYRTVMVLSQMSRAKMMVIAFTVGYGAPLFIAVITVASAAGPENYISKRYACWLNWSESKALLAFVIPALTIVVINLLVLIVVLHKILSRRVGAATDKKHILVITARCMALFTPVFAFGFTWGLGTGTMVSTDLGIHVVFALFNAMQGLFILVFGTLLENKIREALAKGLSQRNLSCPNCTRTEVS